jgi:transposase
MAASTLRKSKAYLGAQFRRLRTKLGAPIAIKATAAKLARLVYRMLRYGMKYVDQGAAVYEAQHRQLQIKQTQVESCQAGIPNYPSACSIVSEERPQWLPDSLQGSGPLRHPVNL